MQYTLAPHRFIATGGGCRRGLVFTERVLYLDANLGIIYKSHLAALNATRSQTIFQPKP